MVVRLKKFFSNYKFVLAGLILFFVLLFVVVIPSFSEKTTASLWDGTVATSFERGNGSSDDPYIINDGSQLAYFFTLMNNSEVSGYFNQNYSLTNNIDLDNIEFPYSNDTSMFSGTFDGNGYTIYNLKITTCSNESFCELSLFGNISYATIKNLNITGGNINSSIENSKLAVLAVNSTSNTISNISINNVELNGTNTSSVAGLVVDDESSEISNLNINISSESENARILISNYSNSNISNVMYNNNGIELIDGLEDNSFYAYSITENNYVHFDKNYPIESILEIVNKNSEYTWVYSNDVLRLQNKGKNDDIAMSYGDETNEFDPNPPASKIDEVEHIVYINDLDSDQNYYDGLNYTSSDNHAYPTSVSKNKYNKYNLVRIQITYSGTNLENNVTGTVSPSEEENKFIYYKVYEVKDNGTPDNKNDDYVEFELIDNPFSYAYDNNTNTTKGFNGWVTSNSNVTVSLDVDTYIRKARVAVTYNSSNEPNDLKIDFNASWINATVNNITSFSNAFDGLKVQTMTSTISRSAPYYICTDYYTIHRTARTKLTGSIVFPPNAVDENLNPLSGECRGCTYYLSNSSSCSDSTTYYKNINGTLTQINYRDYPNYTTSDNLSSGTYLAGYFEKVPLDEGDSISGYYNSDGKIQSGTCDSSGGCTYYKLIQYRDEDGNLTHINKNGKEYYYLPTRDTNIIALNNNITISSDATMSSSKPYTLTGIVNGVQTSNVLTIDNTNVEVGNDFRVENITIANNNNITNTGSNITSDSHICTADSNDSDSGCGEGFTFNTDTNYVFIGNYKNVKFGRGITQPSSDEDSPDDFNFLMIIGGPATLSSSNNNNTYSLIVESGLYAAISAVTDQDREWIENNPEISVKVNATYGNDYDRVKTNGNNSLVIGYSVAGTWGGFIKSIDSDPAITTTIKSGKYGVTDLSTISNAANKKIYKYTSGIYAGARSGVYNDSQLRDGWKGATLESQSKLIFEGGYSSNLYGGVSAHGVKFERSYVVYTITDDGHTHYNRSLNDVYIYLKGGSVDYIFGGSGKNDTACNKIIQLTGGVVNYTVFGGSNGSNVDSSSGNFNKTAESSTLDGNIYLYVGGNVEVGGDTSENYGQYYGNPETGSIFGSANGKSDSDSVGSVNTVTLIVDKNSKVNNNIYGGANYGQTGTACSLAKYLTSKNCSSSYNTTIKIINNEYISGSVYGGGNNNGLGSSDVEDNVTIEVNDGLIETNIYGGSNVKGKINGKTEINFHDGTVNGSIFGGAKGTSDTTPEITGTITVNVSGGTVGNVFGGFDVKGTPSSTDTINISGGTIGNVYGGGNNTANNDTHINMSSGTVTGNMFGGGNNGAVDGTVTITTTGGTIDSLYGGGNGSSASVSDNISSSITNTTINENVYGGGNAGLSSKNVTLNITSSTIKKQIFGGGNQANVNGNIDLDCTTCNVGSSFDNNDYDAIFGGGNAGSVGDGSSTLNIDIDTSSEVKGNIYAGGNDGAVNGTITAIISNTDAKGSYFGAGKGTSATVSGEINNTLTSNTFDNSFYGGGNNGTANSTITSNISNTSFGGSFYGGGNNGAANSTITSNISNTSFGGSFYGGGNGSSATVTGNISTTITGTSLINGSAFGGGNAALSSGNVKFDATGTTIKNQFFGGGNQANITGSVDSDLTTCNIGSSLSSEESDVIFGGGNVGNVGSTINLDIDTSSVIKGIVYGAGYSGTSSGAVTTAISNSTINGAFYGGGYGSTASVAGAIKNNLTNLTLTSTLSTANFKASSIYYQFYGGGRNAPSKSTITTTYNGGSILGRTHGGGNGSSATVSNNITTTFTNVTLSESFYAGGYSAKSNKKISTTLTGCSAKNIIGGGNGSSATVTGAITLKLTSTNASTIYCAGNSAPSKSTVTTTINGGTISSIYGGGNGSKAIVTGAVSLTVTNATISNLVYGGGNNAPSNSTVKVDATGTTIKKGIYGGGNAAVVSGAIDVDLTGCNIGTNASFSGETDTNIIGTVYGGGKQGASGSTVNLTIDGNTRVVGSVFGGGNQGEVTGDITVEILNNNNTTESKKTIDKNVFGGGNAANSLGNINLTINNIKSIGKSVYGGGNNGSVGGNITTNIDSALIEENFYGGGNNGSVGGNITTNIDSALIKESFYGGGKGSAATVTGEINTKIKNSTINVSMYGGGNAAVVSGAIDVDLTGCIIGPNASFSDETDTNIIGTVYGGGNQGASGSTVNLTIDGNTRVVGSVFGGGNQGEVTGDITVEILNNNNTTEDDKTIDKNVFGGGNAANSLGNINLTINNIKSIGKSVYGGGNNGSVDGNITTNINTAKIVGSIYGGGNGSTATVSGNIDLELTYVEVSSDVFGGGNNAVSGTSTSNTVTLKTLGISVPTGETPKNTKIGGSLYGGGNGSSAVVKGNIFIDLDNTSITNSAYGGGNQGLVEGSIVFNTNRVDVTTSLYGGGNIANVNGGITLKLLSSQVQGSSSYGVYGGGKEGTVGTSSNPVDINITLSGATTEVSYLYGGGDNGIVYGNIFINIEKGSTINFNAFGGGNNATVNGSSTITISGVTIKANLYGGGNNGAVIGDVTLNLQSGTIYGNTFGGGNNASVKSTNVSLTNTTLKQSLYGGGNNGSVSQTSTIVINSGIIGFKSENTDFEYENYDRLFGGGNGSSATVYDDINVTIKGGDIYGNVYGGGNAGQANKNVNLIIQNGNIYGNTFGGGNSASVLLNVTVNLTGGIISKNFYCGGNNGKVYKNTILNANGGTVKLSMFGGGNGSPAKVMGNSSIYIGGLTTVGTSSCEDKEKCSLYGGGRNADSGVDSAPHIYVNVNIAGGTIYGNVYGGGNSSTIYGQTSINIGAGVTPTATLTKNDIIIKGTIYGGSESYTDTTSAGVTTSSFGDSSTSTNDDDEKLFNNIESVKGDILIEVDANNYSVLDIEGSIFGSGNYSISAGTSTINISNYGEYENPKINKSIQRTDTLTITNSAILLIGAVDVTSSAKNEYSLTHMDLLILKDNTTLYLNKPTSIIKCLKSVDENDNLAVVTINSDNKTVIKNTDNRIYSSGTKNGEKKAYIHISSLEDTNKGAWGQVYGMTFYGLFSLNTTNYTINVGIYDKYDFDDALNWGETFSFNSYVRGKHIENDNYEQNGFYSNFIDAETSKNNIEYIIPPEASLTVDQASYVTWNLGTISHEYSPIDLVAKMYSTLSNEKIILDEHKSPNTTFEIIGFDTSELDPSVQLVDKNDIPRIAASTTDADNVMALVMENADYGWQNNGSTTFLSDGNVISGTKKYISENIQGQPTFNFYIYHSKNMATTGDMGSVKIAIQATKKISEFEYDISTLFITVNLKREYELSDKYDAALTSGRKYSLFKSTDTSITSKSAISVYFSMYVDNQNIYASGDHRALLSDYAFPENTKITMIDLSNDSNDYYYHVVTQAEENAAISSIASTREARYLLSTFEKMGAFDSDTFYNDALANSNYYHSDENYCNEEYIFIIDFEDTNISSNQIKKHINFDLLNSLDQTKKGVYKKDVLIYNIYANTSASIDLEGTIDKERVYSGESLLIELTSKYSENVGDNGNITDTHYQDKKLGIKLSLYNNSGELVSGTSLLGLNYVIDGINYSPNIDGTTRIKIADKVASLFKWVRVDIGTSNLATGDYKLVIENFASPDGIYYGLNTADSVEFDFRVVNEIYGLNVSTDEKNMIVYANSGLNLANNKNLVYNVIYNSGLDNPNIRVKMYRRNYDEVYDNGFNEVDLQTYVSNSLTTTGESNVYKVINSPASTNTVTFTMKDNLISGTYKVQFILYDGNSAVGSVDKYIIIK